METIRNFFANLDVTSFVFGFVTMAVIGCINGIGKGGKNNVTR